MNGQLIIHFIRPASGHAPTRALYKIEDTYANGPPACLHQDVVFSFLSPGFLNRLWKRLRQRFSCRPSYPPGSHVLSMVRRTDERNPHYTNAPPVYPGFLVRDNSRGGFLLFRFEKNCGPSRGSTQVGNKTATGKESREHGTAHMVPHLLDARGRLLPQLVHVAEVTRGPGLAVVPVLAPEGRPAPESFLHVLIRKFIHACQTQD